MPTKTYYLDATHTEPLTASWGLFYRNFTLSYQGQELVQLSAAELRAGHQLLLPDGRALLVKLQQKFGAQGIDLQVDGQPLSGTVNDLQTQVNQGFWVTMLTGGFSVLAGLLGMFGTIELLTQRGIGSGAFVEGLLYLGLGWLGRYRRQAWAFYTALVLVVLDGISNILGGQGSAGIIVRIFFAAALYRAAAATQQLRRAATEAERLAAPPEEY